MAVPAARLLALAPLLLLLLLLLLAAAPAASRPQDPTTNRVIEDAVTEDDGESFVAGLILAVARDWDEGRPEAMEFVRAVPAVTVNGTTFGPTTHPINESGPISFTAPSNSTR